MVNEMKEVEKIENLVIELSGHRDVTSVEFMSGDQKVLVFLESDFLEDNLPIAKELSTYGFVTTLIESSLSNPWTTAYYYVEVFFPSPDALVHFVSKMLEHKQLVIIHEKV